MTLVTLGLPVYNGEKYLEEALASALAQTHAPLEILISDNASTDRTEEICRRFAATDPRIRYVRHPENRGATFNHNYVVKAARGEYFRWYAYDDRLDPTCIEKCARELDADPETILVWPQTYVIDDEGDLTSLYRTDLPWQGETPSVRLRNLLGRPTEESLLHMCYPFYGLMRRDFLLGTRLLGPYNSADDVLLVELALRGRWYQLPERLFYNRRHAQSSMIGKTPEQLATWYDPSRRAAYPMTRAILLRGYLQAVAQAPLPLRERARCLGIVCLWLVSERRWRVIAGEARRRAGQRLGIPSRQRQEDLA